jgi:hypothetical protein
MNTKILYRPVGIKELELIANLNWKGFPPRLDWQPIFYPVLNKTYAAQIASEWNTQDAFSGYCGIVTQFEMEEDYIHQFNIENVGAEIHNELWIPAAELENFNLHIVDQITITDVFFGEAFILPEHAIVRQALLNFKK